MQIGANILSRMLFSINKSAALKSATNAVVVLHTRLTSAQTLSMLLFYHDKSRELLLVARFWGHSLVINQ